MPRISWARLASGTSVLPAAGEAPGEGDEVQALKADITPTKKTNPTTTLKIRILCFSV